MSWSEEQEKAIKLRGSSILVTAAAGSGKTACMVERVIDMISDAESSVGLDNLVILTFTNAAAMEMKERIRNALNERLKKDPGNKKLGIQKLILPGANISTIHSYCQRLLRDHYEDIGLDPDFRVADENELALIKKDVLNEIFEEKLSMRADKERAFTDMLEALRLSDMDDELYVVIDSVFKLFNEDPWPEERLAKVLKASDEEISGEYEKGEWFHSFISSLKRDIKGFRDLLINAKNVCMLPDGPSKYLKALEGDIAICDTLDEVLDKGYEPFKNTLDQISFLRLSGKKDISDPKKIDYVKEVRKDFKDYINKSLREKFFLLDPDLEKNVTNRIGYLVKELSLISGEFMQRFGEAKRKKNIIDFDDMEHLALRVLYTGDKHEFSKEADELSHKISEIIIDEYQDSSFLQECLLNALSGERFGRHNLFMVGDVKQSIYGFRNARPELFTEKLSTYLDKENAPYRRISLSKNFRSRKEILDSTNDVFKCIMGGDLGSIEYDDEISLKYGSTYPKYEKNLTEIRILDTATPSKDSDTADQNSEGELDPLLKISREEFKVRRENPENLLSEDINETDDELECRMIAALIRKMITKGSDNESFQVTDSLGKLRKVTYKDIAILTRKNNQAETLKDILLKEGIPVFLENSSGYFKALEVNMMLSFLKVLDNPMQDIPLVTIMRGPIYGFTDEELAEIRVNYLLNNEAEQKTEAGDYYKALLNFARDENSENDVQSLKELSVFTETPFFKIEFKDKISDQGLSRAAGKFKKTESLLKKVQNFLAKLKKYRKLSDITPIHELLDLLYVDTGYYDYVAALPDGKLRLNNLDSLLVKALNFSKTNFQGLFDFIRYIEDLEKNDQDMSDDWGQGETGDMVRISTIHKAKGLQFPVVILASCFKAFKGGKKSYIVTDESGIGIDYVDPQTNIKYPGLKKSFIEAIQKEKEVAEEERLLYVAMTRAKEKLIITGALKNAGEKLDEIRDLAHFTALNKKGKYPRELILKARSYMEWILYAYVKESRHFDLKLMTMDDLKEEKESEDKESLKILEELESSYNLINGKDSTSKKDSESSFSKTTDIKELQDILKAGYAYEEETRLRPKISVSAIKKMSLEERMSTGKVMDSDEEDEFTDAITFAGIKKPDDVAASLGSGENSKAVSQAYKGTAFHRAMALLSFEGSPEDELSKLKEDPRFEPEYLKIVDEKAVLNFLKSNMARRMALAKRRGELYREQHFMAGIAASELLSTQNSSELQILQGIIDAYFYEEGQIVVLDYKTDRVKTKGELLDRYEIQLRLYMRALRQLTGLNVKEGVIYSTFLNSEIVIK